MKPGHLQVAVLAWLVAPSCDGAASRARAIPLAELAAELAAAECAVRSQCTGRPLELPSVDCVSQTTTRLANTLVAEVADAVVRDTAAYDETAAPACVAAIRSAGCAAFQTLLPEPCLSAIAGKGAADAPCVSHFDCRADHFCAVDDDLCPGRCRPRGTSVEAPCEEDRACAPGWRCPEIGGRCAPPLAQGSPCELFGEPCAFGATCFAPTIIEPGICEPVLRTWSAGAGEPCALLASYFCGPGLSCPLLSQRQGDLPACVSGAASGGVCLIGTPDPCPAAEYCEGDILAGTGTCTPRIPRGGVCRSSRQCSDGDVCERGVCTPREALGGSCASETGCWSRSCVNGVCVSPRLCRPALP